MKEGISFNKLKKNLKKETVGYPEIKLAIIGDTATQFLNTALRGMGIEKRLNFKIYEADYDSMEQEIFSPDSGLYSFNPDFILLAPTTEKLLRKYYKTKQEIRSSFAKNLMEGYIAKLNSLTKTLNAKVILFNYTIIDDGVFGNFSNKVESSFPFQLRKLNMELMNLAIEYGNLFILDVANLQARYGKEKCFTPKMYIAAKMAFSLEILPLISAELVTIIQAIKGTKLHKCLILDLDNTTWGGIIGDDGLEGIQVGNLGIGNAFTALQLWAKALKERGIILCVCSKNTDSVAREPFAKHPDMILRLEDISVFVANWENKADNIRHIKKVLNIGYDAMVFLDDNPFERNLIREELPEVTVPELPKDPSEYMDYIRSLNLFETASFSGEDNKRTERYQEEAKRVSAKQSFTSIDDYLKNLEMVAELSSFTDFSIPRVAQLTQRSNQFNLRTKRYTESDVKNFMHDNSYVTFQVDLNDKYGNYGLISVIIGEKRGKDLFLDTWIMSCRVLKRGVEKYVLNEIVETCKNKGIERIIGERIPTVKNVLVENHYKDLGFQEYEELWYLDLSTYKPLECFINSTIENVQL